MIDGLNAAFWVMVKTIGALVPADVRTVRLPVAAPLGTAVRMKLAVQSPALAITAATVPPLPLEKSTWPDPWVAPKFWPSMITVLPAGPEGSVAPLIAATTGRRPEGPVEVPPPQAAPSARARSIAEIPSRVRMCHLVRACGR